MSRQPAAGEMARISSERAAALRQRVDVFMDEQVFTTVEPLCREQVHGSGDPATRYRTPPVR